MKFILIVAALVLLTSCSKGGGTFKGVATDVSWEGWVFSSCEVTLKTSDQSSHQEFVSSMSKDLCNELQDNMDKPVIVKYHYRIPAITVDTNLIVDSVEYK